MDSPPTHPIPRSIYVLVASASIVFAVIGAFDRPRTGMYLGTAGLTLLLTFATYLAVPMLERPARRVTGGVGLLAMVVIWGTLVYLIWNAHFAWTAKESAEKLVGSLVLFAIGILPVVLAVNQMGKPRWRVSAWVQRIGFGGIVICAITALWSPWDADPVVGTLFPAALATVSIAALQISTPLPWWLRLGGTLLAIGSALALARLLLDSADPGSVLHWDPSPATLERLTQAILVGFACTLAIAVLNLLLMPRVSRGHWLRWASFGTIFATIALATAFLLDVGASIWTSGLQPASTTGLLLLRLAVATGIVATTMTLLFLNAARTSLTNGPMGRAYAIELTCPRCRRGIELDGGDQSCPHCGLAFRISFDRPTCRTCDQGVDPATSDRCSECGTEIFIGVGA